MNSKVSDLGVYYVVTQKKKKEDSNILVWKTNK